LSDEPSRSATIEAIRLAKQSKALISFDINYRPSLWRSRDDALAQITAVLPDADLLKMNETELALLTNVTDVNLATDRLLTRGAELVVVTLGAQGSYFKSAYKSGYAQGFKVDAIDSTGCGDAFMGALLTQLIQHGTQNLDAQLETALEYANAAGAITAMRRGAIPALPTPEQVREFLASRTENWALNAEA
jgi:fructokinase